VYLYNRPATTPYDKPHFTEIQAIIPDARRPNAKKNLSEILGRNPSRRIRIFGKFRGLQHFTY
jgi:hypothetical protein